MSAIIIDFANHEKRTAHMTDRPLKPASGRQEASKVRTAERQAIRKAIDRNRVFARSDEAPKVAQRLAEMLDGAKKMASVASMWLVWFGQTTKSRRSGSTKSASLWTESPDRQNVSAA